MREQKAEFKFEKSGEDSPWANQYYMLWVGAKKSFEFSSLSVFSNYDEGRFARYGAESGAYKLNGYTYYDDPTKIKELPYHVTGGIHLDLVQTRN